MGLEAVGPVNSAPSAPAIGLPHEEDVAVGQQADEQRRAGLVVQLKRDRHSRDLTADRGDADAEPEAPEVA
jgi:hypothetical protein